jgi:hypothetical protein
VLAAVIGLVGAEWRNQNPLDYLTISRRIWKKGEKRPLTISIAWQLFPNKEAAIAGRISPKSLRQQGCACRL